MLSTSEKQGKQKAKQAFFVGDQSFHLRRRVFSLSSYSLFYIHLPIFGDCFIVMVRA
jgi:hypothetical protein